MKLQAWAIVVLTVITSGCAVSDKNTSSDNLDKTSANAQHVLIDANNVTTPLDSATDEDFDLLEEELAKQKIEIADPLEPWNRMMFQVNDVIYFWVLEPCAKGCKAILPGPVRLGVRNFFNNVTTPIRFVNCLLQGKGDSAGTELNRFAINTTVGILGFGDPARDKWQLEPADEDLGQTLATHGHANGFYIVWPLIGPSTLRDSVGLVGDSFLNPIRYVQPVETSIGISAVKITNENSFRLGEYEAFKSAAVDPYVAMRQAYIQYRSKQVQE